MPDNKGILYEAAVNKALKAIKLQSPSFRPAGSDPNAPDAMLTLGGENYKVEIKLDMDADFGQGSLDYDADKKKWILGGADTESAKQMREFLEAVGVPKYVNREWGPRGAPRKGTVPLTKFKQSDVRWDYDHFTDSYVPNIPADSVTKYYNVKKTYYIQIGGGKYGFYYMGRDIANIGCSKFTPQLRLRIRLKRGGSSPIYNYRFTTALLTVPNSLPKSNMTLDDINDLKAIRGRNGKK